MIGSPVARRGSSAPVHGDIRNPTPAPDREAIAELLFQPGAVVDAPGVPLWRDYRLWSGILLLTTAWIVFAFR